jgi:ATP-dependent Zn protease
MGGIMSIGQSKATEVKPEDVNVTFKDVGVQMRRSKSSRILLF